MSHAEDGKRITRRDFLRRAAVGAAATVGTASGLKLGMPEALGAESKKSGMGYRTLGRTKLKVSELSFGTIRTGNAAVIRRGLDLGINFFDTAECYREGNSEIDLGKALKGRREEAIIATKWHTNGRTSAADLTESLDQSLKRLDMDHVELIQIHGAGNEAQVKSDELWEAFTRARDAGKVRFHGLSTHGNQAAVIRAAIECGRYDAVLPSHNAMTADSVGPAIRQAHEAGLGVIVMKALQPAHDGKGSEAFKGLSGNPYQMAIQWVLKDPNVSTIIVDMPTFDELDEDFAGATSTMTQAKAAEFEAAVMVAAAGACHLCGACTGQCPAGVQVADIMRYALYHDGYGDRTRATSLYRALPGSASAATCGSCSECKVVCPWGVSVRSKLERTHVALA